VSCEERFSQWEKSFAENVFIPAQTAPVRSDTLAYGPETLPFAVSVSWRTLIYYMCRDTRLSQQPEVLHAERIWREVLLGKRPHPEGNEQHMLHVDVVQGTTLPVSPFLNRYLLRALDMDFVTSQAESFTYTKLGRLLLFGFVRSHTWRRWKGTKLHVRGGYVGEGQVEVPSELGTFLNAKANTVAASLQTMSPHQRQKIEDIFRSKQAAIIEAEVFRAMHADVALSGSSAFEVTKSAHTTNEES
jgi:hypothetical protein